MITVRNIVLMKWEVIYAAAKLAKYLKTSAGNA